MYMFSLPLHPNKNKIVEYHFRKSEGREKLDSREPSVRVSRNSSNKEVETEPVSSNVVRNSSRDYFKNFDIEKFYTKMDVSLQTSLENENYVFEQCPSIILTSDFRSGLNSSSPISSKLSTTFVKTNSSPRVSPRLTPEFVFSSDKLTTELHSQVEEKNLDRVLQLLLDPVNGINYRDQQGVTPLHVALRADDQRLAEVLLLHGADPNITDSKLRTSLHYAGLHASYDMMEVLLKYNADYTAKDSTFI